MNPFPPHAYGLLLTFDGYGASHKACADKRRLYLLLERLPNIIGMRSIGFPHIVSVEEPGIAGLSGFTFIMESHISVHTYQEKGFVTADVYSCKNFNTAIATKYVATTFKCSSTDTSVTVRGKRFRDPLLDSPALQNAHG